jgi:hypothetical protein
MVKETIFVFFNFLVPILLFLIWFSQVFLLTELIIYFDYLDIKVFNVKGKVWCYAQFIKICLIFIDLEQLKIQELNWIKKKMRL